MKRVDLPTLGRPMMATLGVPGSRSPLALSRAAVGRARPPSVVGQRDGQEGDDLVEQVAGAAPVQRAHRVGVAQTEGDELPGSRLAAGVVDLVDHEAHRWAGPPDHLGRRQVLVGHAGGHVDHHQDHVGLGQGPLGLLAHLGLEGVARRRASRRCP